MGNASRKRRNVETAIAVCIGALSACCRADEIGSNARCAGSRVVAPLTAELVVARIRGGVRCISSAARCAGCMIGCSQSRIGSHCARSVWTCAAGKSKTESPFSMQRT